MRTYLLYFCFACTLSGCSRGDAPTGVSRTDVEGIWAATLNGTTLLGRSLSGESDWRFDPKTFEIVFLDPQPGQAARISGDWKFQSGKMVMTLRSSFPIEGDVGATDTLFVSVLNNQMSLQSSGGSNILLQKISSFVQQVWHNIYFVWLVHPVFDIGT